MKTRWLHPAGPALGLGLSLLLAGCGSSGGDKVVTPPPPPTIQYPATPQEAMTLFQQSYQQQNAPQFAALFTADFHYTFSADTDPVLVAQYGDSWGKDDEFDAAEHLFDGFTPSSTGSHMPGATNIMMALNSVQFFDDPAHTDSTAYYRWVTVARVVMAIEVPGSPDPQVYNVDSRHEFYLVRGDAAVLESGQPGTSDQWYIRRWDDLSTALGAVTQPGTEVGDPPTPSRVATWGKIKAVYHN